MIIGRDYDPASIATIEQNEWSKHLGQEDVLPADEAEAFDYYIGVFSKLLRQNGDKSFAEMTEEEQQELLSIEEDKFIDAMYHSMLKGHQNAFDVILKESTKFPNLDEDFFSDPQSKSNFIFMIDDKTDPEIFQTTLDQEKVHQLITYTRRHFNSMYDHIISCSKIFYQRGEALAFEQIRKDIVGAEYDTPLISSMTHVPLNRPFRVTPAFLAKFKFEAPYVEQWDIVWDESYGKAYYSNLIATLCINQFNVSQVKRYAEGGTSSFQMIVDTMDLDQFKDEDMIYLLELNYASIDPYTEPRFIYQFEFEYIRRNLLANVIKRLGTDPSHILLAA